mmetsp:Transcript_104165/g.334151  ORF Transcript_104165/g.334151 Transcript_104165/m.334151 type:complete len:1059 (-) Transcript_104165:71-3247(-)
MGGAASALPKIPSIVASARGNQDAVAVPDTAVSRRAYLGKDIFDAGGQLAVNPADEIDLLYLVEELCDYTPPGWQRMRDGRGRLFFHFAATGAPQWRHPTLHIFEEVRDYHRRAVLRGSLAGIEAEARGSSQRDLGHCGKVQRLFDEHGQLFFYSHILDEATWEDPRERTKEHVRLRSKLVNTMQIQVACLIGVPPGLEASAVEGASREAATPGARAVMKFRSSLQQMRRQKVVGGQVVSKSLNLSGPRLSELDVPGRTQERAAVRLQSRVRGCMARSRFKGMLLHHRCRSACAGFIQKHVREWHVQKQLTLRNVDCATSSVRDESERSAIQDDRHEGVEDPCLGMPTSESDPQDECEPQLQDALAANAYIEEAFGVDDFVDGAAVELGHEQEDAPESRQARMAARQHAAAVCLQACMRGFLCRRATARVKSSRHRSPIVAAEDSVPGRGAPDLFLPSSAERQHDIVGGTWTSTVLSDKDLRQRDVVATKRHPAPRPATSRLSTVEAALHIQSCWRRYVAGRIRAQLAEKQGWPVALHFEYSAVAGQPLVQVHCFANAGYEQNLPATWKDLGELLTDMEDEVRQTALLRCCLASALPRGGSNHPRVHSRAEVFGLWDDDDDDPSDDDFFDLGKRRAGPCSDSVAQQTLPSSCALRRRPQVCLLAGRAFKRPASFALVEQIAQELITGCGIQSCFVTVGMPGARSRAEQPSPRLWSFTPTHPAAASDGEYGLRAEVATGGKHLRKDGHASKVARTRDIYITLEGGFGLSTEVEQVLKRGAVVIPLRCTGGASSGLYNFPKKALAKPPFVKAKHWNVLQDSLAPVPKIVAALIDVVNSYMGISQALSGETRALSAGMRQGAEASPTRRGAAFSLPGRSCCRGLKSGSGTHKRENTPLARGPSLEEHKSGRGMADGLDRSISALNSEDFQVAPPEGGSTTREALSRHPRGTDFYGSVRRSGCSTRKADSNGLAWMVVAHDDARAVASCASPVFRRACDEGQAKPTSRRRLAASNKLQQQQQQQQLQRSSSASDFPEIRDRRRASLGACGSGAKIFGATPCK